MTPERLEAIRARTALELRTQYEDGLALIAEVSRLTAALAEAENKLTTLEVNYCDLALSEVTAEQRGYDAAKEQAAKLADKWIASFGGYKITVIPASQYAVEVVKDVRDAIAVMVRS